MMKKVRLSVSIVFSILIIFSLLFAGPPLYAQKTDLEPEDGLITVHNPLGQPPDKDMYSLASRFETLEGKTIYVVDVQYPSTNNFRDELIAALKEKNPEINFVYAAKIGTYFEDDPELWEKIKAEGAGMIIFIGH